MKYAVILLSIVTSVCLSESMTQTDWSGGPGEVGPVSQWLSMFSACSGMDVETPGEIGLGTSFVSFDGHLVGAEQSLTGDVALGDMDGDGDLDIVCSDYPTMTFALYENVDGAGNQWERHGIFDLPWPPTRCILPVDLDQDGDLDLLTACGDFFTYWENTDGSGLNWDEYILSDVAAWEAFDILCFDIDQDGDNDVVGSSSYGNILLSWENLDGSGHQWLARTISNNHIYATDLSAWDYDGDGDMDFFCNWQADEYICLYENMGGHVWTQHEIITGIHDASSIPAGDFDGDGDVDLAVFYMSGRRVYENLDGNFGSYEWHLLQPFIGYVIGYDVKAADLDMDGDTDLYGSLGTVVGSPYPKGLFVYENVDASCDQWERHAMTIQGTDYGCISCCGDINGDGYLDFPGAKFNDYDDEITWFDVIGPADTGWVESSILEVSDADWADIDWTADLPAGSDVYFQVRSSEDWEDMGDWSEPIWEPGSIGDILEDWDQYVQYRATIARSQVSQDPRLLDVTLSWLLGIEPGPAAGTQLFVPNPSRGSVTVRVYLEDPASVALRLYDISGRQVLSREYESMSAGSSSINLGPLQPGIYFCRMVAGDSSEEVSFAVVR